MDSRGEGAAAQRDEKALNHTGNRSAAAAAASYSIPAFYDFANRERATLPVRVNPRPGRLFVPKENLVAHPVLALVFPLIPPLQDRHDSPI